MKHVVFVLLMFVGSTLHAQQKMYYHKSPKQDKDDPEVFNVTKNTELAFAGIHTYCQLQYYNPSELITSIKQDGELKMMSKEDIQKKIDDVGEASILFVTVKRVTIDEANLENFTIVVQDKAGAEIMRGKPEGDRIPRYLGRPAGHYYCIGSLRVDEPFNEEVKVFVIDELKGIRHEYLLRPL